jgi:hypothetical protein
LSGTTSNVAHGIEFDSCFVTLTWNFVEFMHLLLLHPQHVEKACDAYKCFFEPNSFAATELLAFGSLYGCLLC